MGAGESREIINNFEIEARSRRLPTDKNKYHCLRTALDSDELFWFMTFNVELYYIYLLRLNLDQRINNFARLLYNITISEQFIDSAYRDTRSIENTRFLISNILQAEKSRHIHTKICRKYRSLLSPFLDSHEFITWCQSNKWQSQLPTEYMGYNLLNLPKMLQQRAYNTYIKQHLSLILASKCKYMNTFTDIIRHGLAYDVINFQELLVYGLYHKWENDGVFLSLLVGVQNVNYLTDPIYKISKLNIIQMNIDNSQFISDIKRMCQIFIDHKDDIKLHYTKSDMKFDLEVTELMNIMIAYC